MDFVMSCDEAILYVQFYIWGKAYKDTCSVARLLSKTCCVVGCSKRSDMY